MPFVVMMMVVSVGTAMAPAGTGEYGYAAAPLRRLRAQGECTGGSLGCQQAEAHSRGNWPAGYINLLCCMTDMGPSRTAQMLAGTGAGIQAHRQTDAQPHVCGGSVGWPADSLEGRQTD